MGDASKGVATTLNKKETSWKKCQIFGTVLKNPTPDNKKQNCIRPTRPTSVADPGCLSRIRIFSIPVPGSRNTWFTFLPTPCVKECFRRSVGANIQGRWEMGRRGGGGTCTTSKNLSILTPNK
jgi:hypothetical protein